MVVVLEWWGVVPPPHDKTITNYILKGRHEGVGSCSPAFLPHRRALQVLVISRMQISRPDFWTAHGRCILFDLDAQE